MNKVFYLLLITIPTCLNSIAQDDGLLTIDRIYNSDEFVSDYLPPVKWIDNGNAYIIYNRENNNFLIYDIAIVKEFGVAIQKVITGFMISTQKN